MTIFQLPSFDFPRVMQELNVQPHKFETNNGKAPDQSKCKLKFDYTPSADKVNFNLLILLHGLGKDRSL